MANPFRIFRKHQRWFIAAAGLMAIFAFVFVDPLTNIIQGNAAASQDAPVATTTYGTIRDHQLFRMVMKRRILNEFLDSAWRLGYQAGGRYERRPIRFADTEQGVVEHYLLTKKAEELGMVISDRMVNDYLKQITGNSLRPEKFHEILSGYALDGQRVTMAMVFEGLRNDLLVSKLIASFGFPYAVPPGEAWDYYRRLNDVIQAELYPVPVADFVDQTPDPSDAELQKFYDRFKDTEKLRYRVFDVEMEGPDPGFLKPRRAAFAYAKAPAELVAKLNEAEVTEQEIADYYQDNRERFIKASLLPDDEPVEDESAPATETEPEAESQESAQEEAPTAEPADEQPATEAPTTEEPAETPTTAEEAATDTAVPAETKAAPTEGQFNVADSETATEPQPADETPEETEASEVETAEPEASETEAPDAAETSEGLEYEPLENVADEIRSLLASQNDRLEQRREALLGPIAEVMSGYAIRRAKWRTAQEDQPEDAADLPEPERPDLKPLTDPHGLELNATKIVTYFQLRDMSLGQALVLVEGQRSELFSNYAFGGRMSPFKPMLTVDRDGNAYVVWKTEEAAEEVPKLDEIRDQVVAAWKTAKARPLAQAHAKQLAEQAEKSGKPLSEALGEEKAFTTEPFTWLTYGPVPGGGQGRRPRLSVVDGVEGAGPEFMQAIFELEDAQVGVAVNHAESVAYVVRVAEHDVPLETLRARFLRLQESGPAQQMALQSLQAEVLTSLAESVSQEARLDWLRTPDEREE